MLIVFSKKNLHIAAFVLILLSITPYTVTTDYWIVDIFSHFPVQYALLAVILLIVCLWKRFSLLACVSGALIVLNVLHVTDSGNSATASVHSLRKLTVASSNINKSNSHLLKVVEELRAKDSDILLLLEVTADNVSELEPLIRSYRYKIINLNVCASGTGTVLLSNLPIVDQEVIKYSEFGNMMVWALVELNGRRISFYGVHFPKPTFPGEFSKRTKQILDLAERIRKDARPIVVAGDFNMTPFSPIFRKMLRVSGLKDSRDGFGWLPSWPAYFPLTWIPIDHVLVSDDMAVLKRETGAYVGSDHFPVYAELAMSNRNSDFWVLKQ